RVLGKDVLLVPLGGERGDGVRREPPCHVLNGQLIVGKLKLGGHSVSIGSSPRMTSHPYRYCRSQCVSSAPPSDIRSRILLSDRLPLNPVPETLTTARRRSSHSEGAKT